MKRQGFFAKARSYTAVFSAVALNLGGLGIKARGVCSPGFHCHGCPWATCACPVGVIAYGSAMRAIPVLAVGVLLATGAFLGRLVCGFFCPFGLLQDILHKIPSPKFGLPKWTRYIKYAALALLVVALPYLFGFESEGYLDVGGKPGISKTDGQIAVTVHVSNPGEKEVRGVEVAAVYRDNETGEEVYRSEPSVKFDDVIVKPGEKVDLPEFLVPNMLSSASLSVETPQSVVVQSPKYDLYYCKVCPVGTLTAHLPKYFQESPEPDGIYGLAGKNVLRISITLFFVVLMVFVSRAFCRVFCPLGAMYGLISRFSILRLQVDEDSCTGCGLCDRSCPVGLDVRKEVGGAECIACGDCMKACPSNAISRKFGI